MGSYTLNQEMQMTDLRALRERVLEEAAQAVDDAGKKAFVPMTTSGSFDHGEAVGYLKAVKVIRALAASPVPGDGWLASPTVAGSETVSSSSVPLERAGYVASVFDDPPPPQTTDAAHTTVPGDGWKPTHRHYKGGLYRVLGEVTIEATMTPAVLYEANDGRWWVRPKTDFAATVEITLPTNSGLNAYTERVPRFAPLPAPPSPPDREGTAWAGGNWLDLQGNGAPADTDQKGTVVPGEG